MGVATPLKVPTCAGASQIQVFLLGGNHPNDSIYMLQHFINNTFQNLNYPKLASASIVLFVVMSAVFALLYRWVLKKEEMLG